MGRAQHGCVSRRSHALRASRYVTQVTAAKRCPGVKPRAGSASADGSDAAGRLGPGPPAPASEPAERSSPPSRGAPPKEPPWDA